METQTLNHDRTDLWVTRFDEVVEPALLDEYRALITDNEALRAARFIFERDRQQFLVTRALVRTVLSRYADVDPRDWRFAENQFGKPYVSGPGDLPVAFNLSHTAGLVVCAVAATETIGVDVERMDREVEYLNIAKRFFAETEWQLVKSAPSDRRAEVFFRVWTLKEAYIKAHGSGLSVPLSSFTVLPSNDMPPSLELLDSSPGGGDRWQFAQLVLDERFQVAVCMDAATTELEVCVHDHVPLREKQPATSSPPKKPGVAEN